MSPELIHRLSSHRAACKQWSAALGVVILLFGALAGLNPTKMLWAAGPLLFIGLVEAGYAGQERRYGELLKAKKGNEESASLLPEPASASVVRTTFAALSLSIWPFYLGLFALVAVGGQQMAASNKAGMLTNGAQQNYAPAGMVRTVVANAGSGGCGSGSCGSAGGCGSGGCGASSGKGCSGSSCGGATMAQAKRPVQNYPQTSSGAMPCQGPINKCRNRRK